MNKQQQKQLLCKQVYESAKLGRVDEMRELLLQIIKLDPSDTEILAELDRLNRGVRLHLATPPNSFLSSPAPPSPTAPPACTAQSPASTPSDEEQTRTNVHRLLFRHEADKEKIRRSPRPRLRRRQRYLDTCLNNNKIPWTRQEKEDIVELQQDINDELERRKKEQNYIIASFSAFILLALLSLCYFFINNAAIRADIQLRDALISKNRDAVQIAIQKANRPIYTYLCPEITISMRHAQEWIEGRNDTQGLILKLEDGSRKIDSLNPAEYKMIAQLERSHAPHDMQLIQRWNNYKRSKLSEKEKAKVELMNKLTTSIPEEAILCNNLELDYQSLTQEERQLKAILLQFEHYKNQLELDKDYTIKLEWRLKEIATQIKDIYELEQLQEDIKGVTNYKDYLDVLHQIKGQNYPRSQDLYQLISALPNITKLNALMRYTDKNGAFDVLKATEETLLKHQASFTQQFPANVYQIDCMKQIFGERSFQMPLYQLTSPLDNMAWLSEYAPVETEHHISLKRSVLDPLHPTGESRDIKIEKKLGMQLTCINAQKLLLDCDISPSTFFSHAQLPSKLTAILQYNTAQYPILAQAFIFQQVLQTMDLHPWPQIMGFTFSSQLRADQKSFQQLVASCGIALNSESWLMITPMHRAAAAQFQAWFNKRRHHDYALEMKQVLRRVLFVRVRFIGYITEFGEASLCNPLPEDTLLWYISRDNHELEVGTSEDLKHAAPYSPILYSDPLSPLEEK